MIKKYILFISLCFISTACLAMDRSTDPYDRDALQGRIVAGLARTTARLEAYIATLPASTYPAGSLNLLTTIYRRDEDSSDESFSDNESDNEEYQG